MKKREGVAPSSRDSRCSNGVFSEIISTEKRQRIIERGYERTKYVEKDALELSKLLRSRVEFLDSLIAMGEEPYEIEGEVEEIGRILAASISQKLRHIPYMLLYATSNAIVSYVYLYRWSRRSSLQRVPATWVQDLLDILSGSGKEKWPSQEMSITELFLFLFNHLAECEIGSNLNAIKKVLKKFEDRRASILDCQKTRVSIVH